MPCGDCYMALLQTGNYSSKSVKLPCVGGLGFCIGIPLVVESGTDHLEKPTWSTLVSLFLEEIGQMKPRLGHDLVRYLVDQMPVEKVI